MRVRNTDDHTTLPGTPSFPPSSSNRSNPSIASKWRGLRGLVERVRGLRRWRERNPVAREEEDRRQHLPVPAPECGVHDVQIAGLQVFLGVHLREAQRSGAGNEDEVPYLEKHGERVQDTI